MSEHFDVAIIGSGPGGLSAAVTAAKNKVSHVLLERTAHLSDTIFKYQKGKAVMAHPMRLPLQSDLAFDEGNREGILEIWNNRASETAVNVRYNSEVTKIEGEKGAFVISIKDGEPVTAATVIMGIGLQGNLRLLGVPGQDRPWVQYQLDDPDEYNNERIMVVGAGDAGIENAIALASHNQVIIINRLNEFAGPKPGNLAAIERAVRTGKIQCFHGSGVARVDDDGVVLNTPSGEVKVLCDRVIARIGAIAPRKFVEGCGIKFPSNDPAAVPELSATYESNVPGIFIIGALAGYTLIKQAINQGYEVIERVRGAPVQPADEPLLAQRFGDAFPDWSVAQVLEYIRTRVPMLSGLTTLQLREAMLDSSVHRFNPGDVVFRRGDYTSSLHNIAEGEVGILLDENHPENAIRIHEGEFFGELGLVSGRRRTATAVARAPSLLVETPRRSMLRLQSSVQSVKQVLDQTAVRRIVHSTLARDLAVSEIEDVIAASELKSFKAHEAIITEGDPCDSLFIIRTGSATVAREADGKSTALSYVASGGMVGERGLLDPGARRAATVRATIATEAIRIPAEAVQALMVRRPELRAVFSSQVQKQFDTTVHSQLMHSQPGYQDDRDSGVISFLVSQGIGESTNALVIDESLCVRCDNCEKACASTHGGISRLDRDAGATFASVHIPIACRHCENPHCMSDCPVDAITRAAEGEVFIADTCIGCGNCSNNCPYGVIKMADIFPDTPGDHGVGVFGWVLETLGLATKKEVVHDHNAPHRKLAVKCDLCKDVGDGPSCVRACPTGAATRVSPEQYMALIREGQLPNALRS